MTQGLASLKRRFDLGPDGLRYTNHGGEPLQVIIDTVLSATEILVAAGAQSATTDAVFASFQDPEARRLGRIYDFDVALLDVILRSCTLADAITGTKTTVDTLFTPRPPAAGNDKRRNRSDDDHIDRGVKFDSADVYRNGIRRIEAAPGTAPTAVLGLEERLTPQVAWWSPGSQQPAVIYEEWGARESEDERHGTFGGTVTSRGYRLLIREEDLQAFLVAQGRDLIIEVEMTRRDRSNGSSAFDEEGPESASFDRLLLMRGDGRLQAAECDLGAWRTHRPGT